MDVRRTKALKLGKRVGRYFVPLALILILVTPWPGILCALQVSHLQRGQDLLTLPFLLQHTFNLSFTNTLFLAPVVEKFEARGSAIYLKEIATNSWGVVEYYNIPGRIQQEGGEIRIRDINFRVPKLSLMIGFIGKQQLIWNNQNYALYKLSEPGGILHIEVKSLSPGHYFWQRAINSVSGGKMKSGKG